MGHQFYHITITYSNTLFIKSDSLLNVLLTYYLIIHTDLHFYIY